MRTRSMVLAIAGASVLIIALYTAVMGVNTKPPDLLKAGDFAEYSFNVQPSGTNGTYKWEVLLITGKQATVLERISVNSTEQNYTSYLNLETGAMGRDRVTVNGTLRESLCFMMADEKKIPQCPYYSPLKADGEAAAFGRSAVRVIPENSADEYMIFDKQTGIVLEARYGTDRIWSTYNLMETNVF